MKYIHIYCLEVCIGYHKFELGNLAKLHKIKTQGANSEPMHQVEVLQAPIFSGSRVCQVHPGRPMRRLIQGLNAASWTSEPA